MRRRDFIALLGCAAAWPMAANAQQGERVRRIGVVSGFSETEMRPLLTAFREKLKELAGRKTATSGSMFDSVAVTSIE